MSQHSGSSGEGMPLQGSETRFFADDSEAAFEAGAEAGDGNDGPLEKGTQPAASSHREQVPDSETSSSSQEPPVGSISANPLAASMARLQADSFDKANENANRSHGTFGKAASTRSSTSGTAASARTAFTNSGPSTHSTLSGTQSSEAGSAGGAGNVSGAGSHRASVGGSQYQLAAQPTSRIGAVRGSIFGTGAVLKRQQPPQKMQWKQGKMIGSGAFGKVFLGMDQATGALLAAKQFTFEADDSTAAARVASLQREIQIMKKVQHPNVVSYLGADRHGEDAFFIFMEYVPGGSLLGLLRDCGPLAENIASFYCAQVLTGVAFLHECNVVHRDIKGANVLVTVDGVIKLADFGSAAMKEGKNKIQTMEGTGNWMAPEVIRNEAASYSSDVWSIGCTLLEMLTAKPPWSHLGNSMRVMALVGEATCPLDLPADLEVSVECINFLTLCLEPNPNARPTARSLLTHPFVIRHLQETLKTTGSDAVPEEFQADFYTSMSMSANDSQPNFIKRPSIQATSATSLPHSEFPAPIDSPESASLSPQQSDGAFASPPQTSHDPLVAGNGNNSHDPNNTTSTAITLTNISVGSQRSMFTDISRSVSTLSAASLRSSLGGKQQSSILAQVRRGGNMLSPASVTASPSPIGSHSMLSGSPHGRSTDTFPDIVSSSSSLNSAQLVEAVAAEFHATVSSDAFLVTLDHPDLEELDLESGTFGQEGGSSSEVHRPSAVRSAFTSPGPGMMSIVPGTPHSPVSPGQETTAPPSPQSSPPREENEPISKLSVFLVVLLAFLMVVVIALVVALVLTNINKSEESR